MELNQLLYKYRQLLGYTQQEVATFIGVDSTTYAHYESGRRTPNTEKLKKISQVFDISTDELLGVLPINKHLQYDKNNVLYLSQTLEDVGKRELLSNDLEQLLELHKLLKSAMDPVVDEKAKQLEMPEMLRIIPNIKDGTTTEVVHLDAKVERLLFEANELDRRILQRIITRNS